MRDGKTLDAAKAVANKMKARIVVFPTLASTDEPTSDLSVVYTENGKATSGGKATIAGFHNYLFHQ